MKAMLISSVLCLGLLVPLLEVEPCCMTPLDYEGSIQQSAQEAILFHHDGREELILKINYRIEGKGLPRKFAWIITVPNEPDEYAIADRKLFREMHDWSERAARLWDRESKGSLVDLSQGLEFGKLARVGPYEIQPVRALGMEALDGLNRWLAENGFPTEDPKHMEWFVRNRFTFLCVKVTPPAEGMSVASGGEVPPLHLSFRSETPYYPLRFSSRQGVFDLNLYVLTRDRFDYRESADSLRRINWKEWKDGKERVRYMKNVPVSTTNFPATLKQAYAKTVFREYAGKWNLNVLQTSRVNEGDSIATWKDDIFFRTGE